MTVGPVAIIADAYNEHTLWYILLGDGVNLWRVWVNKEEFPDELGAIACAMNRHAMNQHAGRDSDVYLQAVQRIHPNVADDVARNNYASACARGYVPEEYRK